VDNLGGIADVLFRDLQELATLAALQALGPTW